MGSVGICFKNGVGFILVWFRVNVGFCQGLHEGWFRL